MSTETYDLKPADKVTCVECKALLSQVVVTRETTYDLFAGPAAKPEITLSVRLRPCGHRKGFTMPVSQWHDLFALIREAEGG